MTETTTPQDSGAEHQSQRQDAVLISTVFIPPYYLFQFLAILYILWSYQWNCGSCLLLGDKFVYRKGKARD